MDKILLGIMLAMGLNTAANAANSAKTTVMGECQNLYQGEVCTWGTMQGDRLVEFGATIPLATAENAPLDEPMVFPPIAIARIPVPEAVKAVTGVDHLGINWEAHGHPPQAFLTPHFDFHFYMIGAAEAEAIDCSNTKKPPRIPERYALPDVEEEGVGMMVGICVPQMGMHSLVEADLMATEVFSDTMVIGYYDGQLTFVEPMISRARLLGRQTFEMNVPQLDAPPEFTMPSAFAAVFDEQANAYQFTFTMPAGD